MIKIGFGELVMLCGGFELSLSLFHLATGWKLTIEGLASGGITCLVVGLIIVILNRKFVNAEEDGQ